MTDSSQNNQASGNWQEWERYNHLSVGDILRRARLHYGLSLDDVAAALRIRAIHLGALEEGRHDLLPGRVYAIGFVRAYAEYLGLNGGRIVQIFKSQAEGNQPKPELHFPATASESKLPNRFVLGGSLAALVVFAVFLVVFSGGETKIDEIPEVMPELHAQASDLPEQSPLAAAVLGAVEATSGDAGARTFVEPSTRIVITATDSAWLEIRNARGKTLFSRILSAGDSYLVPDETGLKMDTGNAGALSFVVDGLPSFKLGEHGDVKRGVSLEPDALKANIAPASGAEDPAAAAAADSETGN